MSVCIKTVYSVLRSEEYNCMNLMVVGAYAKGKTSLLTQLAKWGTCPEKRTVSVTKMFIPLFYL